MQIEGKKATYTAQEFIVPTGRFVFEEPYVYQSIQDSISSGAAGFWSILVDVVPYTVSLAMGGGRTEEEGLVEARSIYINALAQFDIDPFEAELFWDTYQDVESIRTNPYDSATAVVD